MTKQFFTYGKYNPYLMATALMLVLPAQAFALDNLATPTGEAVVAGSATFNRPAAGQLNVNQSSNRAVINWDRFDIGKNATTTFAQPSVNALAVNRVTGAGTNPTQILGALKSNGQLMVLDRNGVMFGRDSVVDVGGIIASTGDVANADVMDGNGLIELNDIQDAIVENKGSITASDAGLAALVAPTVKNSGVINARFGRVDLAAGSKATVDLYGDDLITLAVDSDLEHALIENRGDIMAEAGTVRMTTRVAEDIVDNSINMSGVVNASSFTQKAGTIILSGAQDITVKGDLVAGGEAGGGDIMIDAKDIHIGNNAKVAADTTFTGFGGTVTLKAANSIQSGGKLSANGEEGGGTVTIEAGDNVGITGKVEARATGVSNGGLIRVSSGGDETRIDSTLNVNGIDGAGTIDLDAANILTLTDKSRLYAETLSTGKGGKVKLDANDVLFDGRINVSGMEGGGRVDINGTGNVDANGSIIGVGHVIGEGARIALNSAQDLSLTGRIDAGGKSGGGAVFVTGNNVTLSEDARIYARGLESDLPELTSNPGGRISINATNDLTTNGILNVSGTDSGGRIRLAGSNVLVNGNLDARSVLSGEGGNIGLFSNGTFLNVGGRVNASGVDGGGRVTLSSQHADPSENSGLGILSGGIITANGVKAGTGGNINLDAVNATIDGTLNANGMDGGGNVRFDTFETQVKGLVSARGLATGTGGNITMDNDGDTTIIGSLNANGADGGGRVRITADDVFLNPESSLFARATETGVGGRIAMNATGEVISLGLLNGNGINGGGNIGLNANFVRHSGDAFANGGEAGNGGRVHLNGMMTNDFDGAISARGGSASGNGGTVIVNRPNNIDAGSSVDVTAANGTAGTYTH